MTKAVLTVAICDFDDLGIEQIKAIVTETLSPAYQPEVISCHSFQELMMVEQIYHILILNTQMENGRGIELSQLVHQAMPECKIMFITDYLPHVSMAYQVPHFCLLLKDHLEQLPFFLRKAAEQTPEFTPTLLEIHIQGRSYLLPIGNILYLERQGHITYIHHCNGQIVKTREKLDTLLQNQTCGALLRCHVSYVVNLDHVREMGKTYCILTDGTNVPISRVNQKQMKSAAFQRKCAIR